jgi:hypothetical protein
VPEGYETEPSPRQGPAQARRLILLPVAIWLLGMLVTFHPTVLSRFAEVQGGLGDTRLVNFTLEHTFRWLTNHPMAEDLWSPPIHHPHPNVATYTDIMLGVTPFYWIWRMLGCAPHTAFQMWMLVIWSLNFGAMYLFLRRWISCSSFAAAAGAYLFAFASPRMVNFMHQQLVVQFYLVLSLAAVISFFREQQTESPSWRKSALWLITAAGGLVLQFYTAFYCLFFALLGAAGAGLAVVCRGSMRRTLFRTIRRNWVLVLLVGLTILIVSTPLLGKYRQTVEEVGARNYHTSMLPSLSSWLVMGKTSCLYGWTPGLVSDPLRRQPMHQNGLGLVTTSLVLIGLWHRRRDRLTQLFLAATITLFLLTLRLPGDASLWYWVHRYVPGGTALRAVGRVGIMGLFPAALGFAWWADRLTPRRPLMALLLCLLVAAEQVHLTTTFNKQLAQDRIAEIVTRIPDGTTAFFLVDAGGTYRNFRLVHDDAEWVALAAGIPTINGRYGNVPPGWNLSRAYYTSAEEAGELRTQLDGWISKNGLDPDRIAWIEN